MALAGAGFLFTFNQMDFFKIFLTIAPFISAGLASFLTYSFGTKAKRKEYLYQNRVESFRQIAIKVSELKKYCFGKIALIQGNEFSPFFDLEGSGLMHRSAIADTVDFNQIFLTKKSRQYLDELIAHMSFICNKELAISGRGMHEEPSNDSSVYESTVKKADECLAVLYRELDLD
ncbi:hypothetical protein [Hymenobacter sp. BT730]|uniref:hypothetical protein n=1 Tax=Hymenobacter sp. BT730 TaxID=3063332 RepID=UPI0026DFEF43|nr:hypothetical protein [Hymenobacter sp. BT730]